MAMKKGLLRKSCFVERTHSQSPFMSAGSTALCVATSASTASAISRRCCALYLSSGAYALCWNRRLAAIGQSAELQKPALQLIGRGGGRDGAASALDATRTTRGEGGEPPATDAKDDVIAGCRKVRAGNLVARKWRLQIPAGPGVGPKSTVCDSSILQMRRRAP